MTTTFPTDNRNILSECDATTGWTATDGPTTFSASPTPIESGVCLGMQVSNDTQNAYISITSDDYSGGGTLSVWVQDRAEFDLTSNVGIGIVVGDGTNRIAYAVGGSDGTAFRHDTGPVKWACFLLDLANKPANFVALAGSEANLNEAAITQVGIYFNTTVKSVGGTDNCFWDIIRWADNGDDVVMQGGTTSGAAGNGSEAAAVDRSTGNQQAYGVIRELATGVYGIQGNLTIGNTASSSNQYWEESLVTYAWEDRGLSANNYYRFFLRGSSTATTCSVIFSSCTFIVPSTASAQWDSNNADLDTCDVTGSVISGFDQGVILGGSTQDYTDNSFLSCGRIDLNETDISGSSVLTSVVAADEGAIYDNRTTTTATVLSELDNITISKGTNAHHALRFGSNVDDDLTLTGVEFTNFSSTDDANDSTIRFDATTGSLTLNLVGCTVGGAAANATNVGIDAAAGLTVTISVSYNFTITGLELNTEVTIVTADTETELFHVENATTSDGDGKYQVTYSHSGGASVDILIHEKSYKPDISNIYGLTLPAANSSAKVQMFLDENYENPT